MGKPDLTMRHLSLVTLLGTLALPACNLLTGADDLEVSGAGGNGSNVPTGSDGTQVGPSGSGPGNQASAGTQTSATTGMPLVEGDVQGVTVDRVAFYQGVQAIVMDQRAEETPAVPVIERREALVRVFVSLAGYDGMPVTARLTLGDGSTVEREVTLTASSETDLGSTVNLEIPADKMVAPFSYRVSIVRDVASAPPRNDDAHYPSATTSADITLKRTGVVRVVLVPIRYNGDGSGRVPDLGAGALKLIQDEFDNQYPAEEVELTIAPEFTYNQQVGGTSGWNEILDAITQLRAQQNPAQDVYYYGLFNPRATYDGYLNTDCGGGSCYAGLGWIAQPTDAGFRAAVGLGYTDVNAAAVTATHELGHNHGRDHAPCGGASGVDPGYPYADGTIGELGYDRTFDQLIDDGSYYDIMSYCFPHWPSDYTYRALADRIAALQGNAVVLPPDAPTRFERVEIIDGTARRLPNMQLPQPMALTDAVRVEKGDGATASAFGRFVRYDHIDGGVLLLPEGTGARKVEVGGRNVEVR